VAKHDLTNVQVQVQNHFFGQRDHRHDISGPEQSHVCVIPWFEAKRSILRPAVTTSPYTRFLRPVIISPFLELTYVCLVIIVLVFTIVLDFEQNKECIFFCDYVFHPL